MVDIFGYWINPHKICYLQDLAHGCHVSFGSNGIDIRNKTAKDVAGELNKHSTVASTIIDDIEIKPGKIVLIDKPRKK